jgi:hypothetical protein
LIFLRGKVLASRRMERKELLVKRERGM